MATRYARWKAHAYGLPRPAAPMNPIVDCAGCGRAVVSSDRLGSYTCRCGTARYADPSSPAG